MRCVLYSGMADFRLLRSPVRIGLHQMTVSRTDEATWTCKIADVHEGWVEYQCDVDHAPSRSTRDCWAQVSSAHSETDVPACALAVNECICWKLH